MLKLRTKKMPKEDPKVDQPEEALWEKARPPKGKKLIKVCDHPATWVEIKEDATEEEIQARIDKFRKDHPNLKDRVEKGEFRIPIPKEKKYVGYSGPIYSIPRIFYNKTR